MDENIISQLFRAISDNNLSGVKQVWDDSFEVNRVYHNPIPIVLEMAPIHLAAGEGFDSLVRFLLKKKADIDFPDTKGMTALHHATWHKRSSTVKLLLENHAKIAIRDEKNAILFFLHL